jgi:RNA polymerase sigma-70 factor (ECF subfamily)
MEDKSIIGLFFQRSERAIAELRDKYGRAVLSLSQRILGSLMDAEECADDTYMGVWNTVPPQYPEHLKAYTLTIARNLSIDRYHSNNAAKRNSQYDVALDELADCLAGSIDPVQQMEVKELGESINSFLATLKTEDRQIFVSRYYLSEPVSQIGERLGLDSKKVSSRLFRIREKLRSYLEKDGVTV